MNILADLHTHTQAHTHTHAYTHVHTCTAVHTLTYLVLSLNRNIPMQTLRVIHNHDIRRLRLRTTVLFKWRTGEREDKRRKGEGSSRDTRLES